jgi:hypothetical protein
MHEEIETIRQRVIGIAIKLKLAAQCGSQGCSQPRLRAAPGQPAQAASNDSLQTFFKAVKLGAHIL